MHQSPRRREPVSPSAAVLWFVTFWAPLVFAMWFYSGELMASAIAAALVVTALGALVAFFAALGRLGNSD